MKSNRLPYKKILFVCVNEREPGERICCAGGGGQALRDKLKQMVKERGLKGRIRVSQSGCMDRCEFGPNMMIFPDNIWLSGVNEEDLERIMGMLCDETDEPGRQNKAL